MATENKLLAETVKTYRPWVGVVLSFFITGAAQFLSGKRLAGVSWFVGLSLMAKFIPICLASPVFRGGFALGLLVFTIGLWLVMLIKSYKRVPRLSWYGWLVFLFLLIFFSYFSVLGSKVFVQPFEIPTNGMFPTIRGNSKNVDGSITRGDRIFVERYAYWFSTPKRGDIIIMDTKGVSSIPPQMGYFIKRIIGIPGDNLSIQNGHLYNHGQILSQPPVLTKLEFLNPSATPVYLGSSTNYYTVPTDSYFVIGDNTTNSFDSRYFGAIPKKNIIGKVSKIYWPLNRAGRVQ